MSTPRRLIDEGSSLDRALLSAGREEQPSEDLERRVLAAVGAIGAGAAASAGAATGAATAAATPRSLFHLLRSRALLVVATSVTLGVVGGVGFLVASREDANRRPSPAPSLPAPAPGAGVTAEAASDETSRAAVTPASLPDAPAAPASAPSTPSAPSAPTATTVPTVAALAAPTAATAPTTSAGTLEREIALLDTVKSRLDPAGATEALRTLDTYDREFPSGALRPEARVLRIRALLLRGDRAAATALAEQLLASDPSSVHARRVRALLAD